MIKPKGSKMKIDEMYFESILFSLVQKLIQGPDILVRHWIYVELMFLNVELQYLADIAIQQRRTFCRRFCNVFCNVESTFRNVDATFTILQLYVSEMLIQCVLYEICSVTSNLLSYIILSFSSKVMRDQYQFVKSGFITKYHLNLDRMWIKDWSSNFPDYFKIQFRFRSINRVTVVYVNCTIRCVALKISSRG